MQSFARPVRLSQSEDRGQPRRLVLRAAENNFYRGLPERCVRCAYFPQAFFVNSCRYAGSLMLAGYSFFNMRSYTRSSRWPMKPSHDV
jgi:hypothetical protein